MKQYEAILRNLIAGNVNRAYEVIYVTHTNEIPSYALAVLNLGYAVVYLRPTLYVYGA